MEYRGKPVHQLHLRFELQQPLELLETGVFSHVVNDRGIWRL